MGDEELGDDELDDQFDSPFAHVPDHDAGPSPMQEGAFTYDKMIASAGSARSASAPRWARVFMLLLLAIVVFGLLASYLLPHL